MQLSKYIPKLKYLYDRNKKSAGRNNTGRITVAHQGGGHKQLYRKIIFKGNFIKGFVTSFEYDPNRSAHLAKVCYFKNMEKFFYYILAPQNLKILDIVEGSSFKNIDLNALTTLKQVGNSYLLQEFHVGDFIYNIELKPNKGAQFVRAGGTSALVLQKLNNFILVKLPSGEHRLIPSLCKAFFGNLSNENHCEII